MAGRHAVAPKKGRQPVESSIMATQTLARRIDAQVEKMAGLEELATQIQASDEETASSIAKQLDHSYPMWYAQALTLLPDDLKDRFRFEYQGDFLRDRIRKFVGEPRKPSVTYHTYTEEFINTFNPSPWQYSFSSTFRDPFTSQKSILLEARARYGFSSEMLEALQQLEHISRRLPISFAVLGREMQHRLGLQVEDEYDVQRILHAICVTVFEEVEYEEPTPKIAAGSSRLDFLLKRERVAIETKMIGDSLTLPRLRGDLAKDIVYFRSHPKAGSLFIFVHDPSRKIMNPVGFESDFQSDSDNFPIRIVVASLRPRYPHGQESGIKAYPDASGRARTPAAQ
jgi:hypothetical protein